MGVHEHLLTFSNFLVAPSTARPKCAVLGGSEPAAGVALYSYASYVLEID